MIVLLYVISSALGLGACIAALLAVSQGQDASGLYGAAAQIAQMRSGASWALALQLAGACVLTAFGARLLTRLEELIEAVRQPKVSMRISDAAPTPPPMPAAAPSVTPIPFPRPKPSGEPIKPST
jgi:hypothetical protein